MVKTFYGVDLVSYDINKDYVSSVIHTYGCWEPIVTNVMLKILNSEAGTCIDVGTYIGYYTFLFNKFNKTIGIEADPSTYEKIIESSNKLSNPPILYNKAASYENDQILNFAQANSTNRGASRITNDESNLKISTVKLDSLVENEQNILICKIDAEGHELSVLQGMNETLSKKLIKYLFLELSPVIVGVDESIQICKLVMNYGYDCYDLNLVESGYLESYKNYEYKDHKILNIEEFVNKYSHQRDILFVKKD
jgi:FkbM family methyltransferase